MTTFLWVLAVVAGGLGLFFLDRFLLWAEGRSWIYYRKRKANPGTLGSAFLQVQSILQPDAQQAAVELRAESVEEDEVGEPPSIPPDPAKSPSGRQETDRSPGR
jgi:hypothetical protein